MSRAINNPYIARRHIELSRAERRPTRQKSLAELCEERGRNTGNKTLSHKQRAKVDVRHKKLEKRLLERRSDNEHFVNALRAVLGLDPLPFTRRPDGRLPRDDRWQAWRAIPL